MAWAMLAAGCACVVAVLIAWPVLLSFDAAREAAQADLGQAAYSAAWEVGRAMTRDEAISAARSGVIRASLVSKCLAT